MPLEVKKEPKESPQRIVHRFIKKMRKSGLLLEARKRQFYQRPPNTRAKKLSALRRKEKEKEYEELKRLGKI